MDSKFKELMAETFEIDIEDVNDDIILDPESNWDSIAHLSIVSGIDSLYNIQIRGDDLLNCSSVSDLYLLVEKE